MVLITSNDKIKRENFSFRIYIPIYDYGSYFYNINTFQESVDFYRITMKNGLNETQQTNFPIFNFKPTEEVLSYEVQGMANSHTENTLFYLKSPQSGEVATPITDSMQESFIQLRFVEQEKKLKTQLGNKVQLTTFSLNGVNYGFELPLKSDDTKVFVEFTELSSLQHQKVHKGIQVCLRHQDFGSYLGPIMSSKSIDLGT